MENKKNIYQKLAEARNMLRLKNIKPTGKNQGRFTYYELEDILPAITEICAAVGILPIMNYYPEKALLTIFDTTSDQTITLESPMSTAKLAGCHEVQNLGAVETYEKRYLYMHAFDVAESDVLDGTVDTGKPKDRKPAAKPAAAPAAKPAAAPAAKAEAKAPADIAGYLKAKGIDDNLATACGNIWNEAKGVLDPDTIEQFKADFKKASTPEEFDDWYRAVYWRVDAANKAQDALVNGTRKAPEFEDDSPTLYEEARK